jgi:predicted nucleic acid-binding protein
LMVRSLDAIHVASAVAAGAKTMVATDGRLRKVSRRIGLQLLPPA